MMKIMIDNKMLEDTGMVCKLRNPPSGIT